MKGMLGVSQRDGACLKRARLLVPLLIVGCLGGCDGEFPGFGGFGIPRPRSGILDAARELMVEIPGGRVNAYGGNLHIARNDFSLDTRIGTWLVGAVWNASSGVWQWNFQMTLHAPRPDTRPIFTDETGYQFYLRGQPYGESLPGSSWVLHDDRTMRTAGGLMYRFNDGGALETVHWASAAYPALSFVRKGPIAQSRVLRIEQCRAAGDCSPLFWMAYDIAGRLTSITDLAGRVSRYTYEGTSHRVASARDALDVENGWPGSRYDYDVQGRLTALTNSHGERVEYQYYADSPMIMKVEQQGEGDPLWAFAYLPINDDFVATTTVVDPLGAATSYYFDLHMRPWRRTNALGESWRWSWFENTFKRIGEIGPDGVHRGFSSPEEGVWVETHASGNAVIRTQAPWPAENRANSRESPLLEVRDDLGLIESRSYAASGLLESISNGEGETEYFVYAPNGDLTRTDRTGVETLYEDLGDHGHYATRTRGGRTVHDTYDAVGNLLTTDGLLDDDRSLGALSAGQGGVVSRTWDVDRNLASLLLEDGGAGALGTQVPLVLEWRADHKTSRIERPYGGDTEFLYDSLGRVIEQRTLVDSVWRSRSIQYDLNGRTTAVLRPNGMASRATHDLVGRVASLVRERDWHDPVEQESQVDFEYVSAQLVAIRDSSHGAMPETYFYDADGRIDEVGFPHGESLLFARDPRGRISSKQYLRSDASVLRTFAYEYDLADRVTQVREDGLEIANFAYQNDRLVDILYANGVTVSYEHDPVTGALAGFSAVDATQQLVASMAVSETNCDFSPPESRCIHESTTTHSGVVSVSAAEYQVEDQATERLIADAYGLLAPSYGFYRYDELSNLVASPAGSFVYNEEHNRLLAIEDAAGPVVDYTFDEAGFVTSRNGVAVTWNALGRVTSIGPDFTMRWDALGRKLSAAHQGVNSDWRYGGEVRQDESGSLRRLDLGWISIDLDPPQHEYRLVDFRGNAKLLLDDAGEVIAHHHYAGYERLGTDGADLTGGGYAGGSHVDELVIVGQRVYDPIAGRFLSQDPIDQTINQYVYTLGNPIRFWDPGGDHPVPIGFNLTFGVHGPVPFTMLEIEWDLDHQHAGINVYASGSSGDGESGVAPASGANPGSGVALGSSGIGSGQAPSVNLGAIPANHCGLGFEISPILVALYFQRVRRRRRSLTRPTAQTALSRPAPRSTRVLPRWDGCRRPD